jgi:hypothetical protein
MKGLSNAMLVFSLALTGCAASRLTLVTDYEKPTNFQPASTSPESVKVLEEQYPEGLTMKNNVLEVEDAYKNAYVILGSVKAELKPGAELPFFLGGNYKPPEDWNGLNKYCAYNPFGYIIPLYNLLLNPFAWPCWFQDTGKSENQEGIKYRKDALVKEVRTIASRKGANMVVGLRFGGIGIINAQTGIQVANMNIYSASGYLIYKAK